MVVETLNESGNCEQQLLKDALALAKTGKSEEALAQLRDALRRGQLSAEGVEKAGRHIARMLKDSGQKAMPVLLLGQCTGTWLGSTLTACAWAGGSALRVRDGQYDNVAQELMAAQTAAEKPAVVVLLPWHRRLLESEAGAAEKVEEELAFWQQAWEIVTNRLGARLIQVGMDWTTVGPLGHHLSGKEQGRIRLIRQVNEAMWQRLPASAYFVDLEQVSGELGRENFYDFRRYFWTKQPFSEEGTVRLAHAIWSGIRAVTSGPKKVLVLDLDNTLWGGVVGETGPLGIELGDSPAGEAYQAFQKYVKELARRGCVLAVCSKNNPDDAREPFQKNPHMRLTMEDFGAFEASWDPKAVAIERIAQTLQLGMDSFVFFDDNPAEREHIRQALPEVEVADVPEDPAEYVRALERGHWFEAVALTEEDHQRSQQYRAEAQRREIKTGFASMEEYLASTQMVGDVRAIDEADFPRVIQLLGKTNQFNLTTRRHSADAVRQMMAQPGFLGMTVRMSDRFGDYGLIAVIMGINEPGETNGLTLRIDTWLMSCRVIGRTAEEFCLAALVERAKAQGYRRLLGQYIPTKKNGLVKDLFDRLGFRPLGAAEGGTASYELPLEKVELKRTFVATGRAGA